MMKLYIFFICYISQEDISARLMEFLESPHVTREILLSEKAKVCDSISVQIKLINQFILKLRCIYILCTHFLYKYHNFTIKYIKKLELCVTYVNFPKIKT